MKKGAAGMANAAYLTFEEYQSYGGTIGQSDFPAAEFKARKRIDYLTDSRVQTMRTVPDAVKLCMTILINADSVYGADALAKSPLAASFSTDGYSESYGSAAEQTEAMQKALDRQITEMLSGEVDDNGTPLLYRGLDR